MCAWFVNKHLSHWNFFSVWSFLWPFCFPLTTILRYTKWCISDKWKLWTSSHFYSIYIHHSTWHYIAMCACRLSERNTQTDLLRHKVRGTLIISRSIPQWKYFLGIIFGNVFSVQGWSVLCVLTLIWANVCFRCGNKLQWGQDTER